jgi:uncharacterized protein
VGIRDARAMNIHPMRGALFENLCVSEYGKHLRNTGAAGSMYFWHDNIGNEVDLLIERAGVLQPVEFKSGATFQPEWLRCLHVWRGMPPRLGKTRHCWYAARPATTGCRAWAWRIGATR